LANHHPLVASPSNPTEDDLAVAGTAARPTTATALEERILPAHLSQHRGSDDAEAGSQSYISIDEIRQRTVLWHKDYSERSPWHKSISKRSVRCPSQKTPRRVCQDAATIVNAQAVQDAKSIIEECDKIFPELSAIVKKSQKHEHEGKSRVSLRGKISLPFR
jgi:hypothetical protein